MARYTGQLLAPAEAKKGPIMLFWPILGNFLFSVVTLLIFSSNPNKFEKRKKNSQNFEKFKRIQKIYQNPKKKKKVKKRKK